MATVEELDFELNFKWDKKTFSKFNDSLKKSIAGFAKLGAAIAAAQGAAFAIAKRVADQNDQLAKLAPRLNTTTEEYQRLEFAAKDFGATSEDVTSSLRNLAKAQEDILRGKGDIEAFGRLGINPSDFKNSADLLLVISDRISRIQSTSEKINLLERIGISTNLLQLLEAGSAKIRVLGQEFESYGALVSKEQKKLADEFQSTWLRTLTITNGVLNQIGSNLLKNINEFLRFFVKFAQKNMKQIVEGFERLFKIVNKVSQILFAVLNRIFTIIGRIVNLMGGLENAVMAAAAAFIVLKRKMLLAFIVPLAIATALFLVLEDIVSAVEGKDSFFGDWLDAVNQLPEALEAISIWFDVLIQKIKQIGSDIADAFSFDNISFPSFDNINLPSFGDIGNTISGLFGSTPQAQAITNNNGGARNANVTINVNGASGSVIDEINQYFQQSSNRIFGE